MKKISFDYRSSSGKGARHSGIVLVFRGACFRGEVIKKNLTKSEGGNSSLRQILSQFLEETRRSEF